MRVEINLVLFFPKGKEPKKIDGFLSVSEAADDDEVMEAMGEFIELVTEEHMETFTSGVAQLMVGADELYHISFQNPRVEGEGASLCNVIIPEDISVH